MRLHSEKQACPRRRSSPAVKTVLSRRQPEQDGKVFWDAEQLDGDSVSCCRTRIASQPLCPGEARVGTLCAGQDHVCCAWRSCGGWWQAHLDALMSREPHTGPPVLSPAPIPRSRSGARPTWRGCSRTLTWRGFAVALPCPRHCSRSGQGRQLRMLAAYTTRRLPSASRRCSWADSDCPAGQRSVPSGWRGKSWPEKRPVFQEVAMVGGPYPAAGTDEAAACSLCGAMAGANSVVRRGVGST